MQVVYQQRIYAMQRNDGKDACALLPTSSVGVTWIVRGSIADFACASNI